MDKYEYQVRADQIKSLIAERRFPEAMDIADTIDWRRVKSFSMLCTVSEIYKVNKHYEESRDILLLAYERYPDRANVVYALCELAIKLDDLSEAVEYYKEYVRLKPNDTNRYILLYKIYEAQDVPIDEKVSLLEEFIRADYSPKWAFELAQMYHKAGQEEKCIEECDKLILWFGDGPYVRKAMELKMQHAELTPEQRRKYDAGDVDIERDVAPTAQQSTYQTTNVSMQNMQGARDYYNGQPNSYVQQDVYGQNGYTQQNAYGQQNAPVQQDSYMQPNMYAPQGSYYGGGDAYSNQGYMNQNAPSVGGYDSYGNIQVQPVNTDRFSTLNLQEELARNMQEVYSKESAGTAAPYYGETANLYEPSQEQYLQQLAQAEQAQNQMYDNAAYISDARYEVPSEPKQDIPMAKDSFVQDVPVHDPKEGSYYAAKNDYAAAPVAEEEPNPSQTTIKTPIYTAPIEMPKEAVAVETAEKKPAVSIITSQAQIPIPSALPSEDEEADGIEKQITGQIDLSDFIEEWEAKKQSGRDQRMAEVKKKTLDQTADLMEKLVGVIPGLEAITHPETVIPGVTGPLMQTEELLHKDEKSVVTKTVLSTPNFSRDAQRTEVKQENVPEVDIPEVTVPEETVSDEKEDEEAVGEGIIDEAVSDEDAVEEVSEEAETEPVIEEEEPEEITFDLGSEPVEMIPEEAEQIAAEDEAEDEPVEESEDSNYSETEVVTPIMNHKDVFPDEDESEEEGYPEEEEPVSDESDEEAVSDEGEIEEEQQINEPKQVVYPYEVTDFGEVEEIELVDQPDEVDDMIKTTDMPIDEISAHLGYDIDGQDGSPDEEMLRAEAAYKKPMNHPSYMVLDDTPKSKRDFDDNEYAIFGRIDEIESLKAQIVDAIDDMSMEAHHGNVIVTGSEMFGRKDIAIDMVRAMQSMDSAFSGKVAKISGEALNKKNIPVTMAKLTDGALIVEDAGGLSPLTMNEITDTLINDIQTVLVVLEGDKEDIDKLLAGSSEAQMVFNARVHIDDFTNDDLVAYAKGYARELEYSIDEMGILALYQKIGDRQSFDHKVGIDEVLDMMDNAIRHVDRKNMTHFMDVLLAKRYDDDDYIVLREKDFMD